MIRKVLLILPIFISNYLFSQMVAANDYVSTKEDSGIIVNVQQNDNLGPNTACQVETTILIGAVNGNSVRNANNTHINYTPNTGFFGKDSIKYRITECAGGTGISDAWIFITIDTVNKPPSANMDRFTVFEDRVNVLGIKVNDFDREGGTLTTTIFSSARHGVASIPTVDSIRYITNLHYFGLDTFIYRLCDNGVNSSPSLCDTAIVYLTVLNTDDTLSLTKSDTSIIIGEDSTFCVSLSQFVVDLDREYTWTSSVKLNSSNGVLTGVPAQTVCYKPNSNFNGKDTFKITCKDANNNSIDFTVYVTVTPKDDTLQKLITDTSIVVKEDSSLCINMSNTILDIDNENSWTLSSNTSPRNGTVTFSGKTFCYAPTANFNGKDTMVVKACDANNNCKSIPVYITVTPVIDSIFAKDDTFYISMNTSYLANPGTNDKNVDNLSYTISGVTMPLTGSFTQNGNNILYTPKSNFIGVDEHSYTISTPLVNYTSIAKIVYIVTSNPQSPKAVDDNYTIPSNKVVAFDPTTNDFSGNLSVTTTVFQLPKRITLSPTTTTNQYTVFSPTYLGYDTAYYSVCNSISCDTAMIVFLISNSVKPITKADTTILRNPMDMKGCLAGTSVPEADSTFQFSIVKSTSTNVFSMDSKGCWVYNYGVSFEGLDSFKFLVCNSGIPKLCDTQTHYILVKKDNSLIQVSNSISPNGDGMFDFLIVDNIALTTNNNMTIFNRWGDIVYERANYQNDWAGTNEKGGINQSDILPDGVYYYIFNYELSGNPSQKTGYIYLKK